MRAPLKGHTYSKGWSVQVGYAMGQVQAALRSYLAGVLPSLLAPPVSPLLAPG